MSPASEDQINGKAPTVSIRLASITEAESRVLIEQLDAEFARNYTREHLHGLRPGEEMDSRLRFYLLEHSPCLAPWSSIATPISQHGELLAWPMTRLNFIKPRELCLKMTDS